MSHARKKLLINHVEMALLWMIADGTVDPLNGKQLRDAAYRVAREWVDNNLRLDAEFH